MANIILYHGTAERIVSPSFGLGNEKHDYGKGFYLTESVDLAKEWAVCRPNEQNGWIHRERMHSNFEDKIFELINLKQEGEYWDFKRQWHENKADLLHDIICMANNLSDNDGYIIIGIDEEKDYSIRDVKLDENRKNTQKIVDFLKDKKFAGDNRPTVYVQTIEWAEENIDVVVVQNNMNTPYYLAIDYRDKEKHLKANHIYTRIMDSNTAKDCNADLDKVEYLWKKRFGINKSALERVTIYLKDKKNWFQNEFEVVYYKYAPEFTIKCEYDESRKGYEVYMLGQIDNTPHWYDIQLYYHSTLLHTVSAVALDGSLEILITNIYLLQNI